MSRLHLLVFFLHFSIVYPSHLPGIITVPLTATLRPSPLTDPLSILASLTSHSLSRAHHLRHRSNSTLQEPPVSIPLNPRTYGGYSATLTFGSPPQAMTFVLDTGSSLVWFPCTSHYVCVGCNSSATDTLASVFIPKKSSSVKILGCRNPRCRWFYGPDALVDCPAASEGSRACSPYAIQYGIGSTSGILLLDTLSFSVANFSNFVVGCSIASTRQPEGGIAGFGRSPVSLPSQLGLKRFSYCLVSHVYDDNPWASSSLTLDRNGGHSPIQGLSYTPFRKNPTNSPALQEFYYVNLRRITIGNRSIKIPHMYSFPGVDGNGGTVVDTGSTFTYMERPLFELVTTEFKRQMGEFNIASDVENTTGLMPCFRVPNWPASVPEMAFHFKNGATMELLLSNYFPLVGSDIACLLIITDTHGRGGPSVIVGNYQQMNFYVEYDLDNQKFGFKRHNCMSSPL